MDTTNRLARLACLTTMLPLQDALRIADIGANPMNHDAPYKMMLENGHCRLTGFEPQQGALERLNQAKGPNETYLPAAIGDGNDQNLQVYHGSGLTSLLQIRDKTLTHLRGLRRAAKLQETISVKTSRLDDIAEIGRIDFLKIDIQGAELSVFENGQDALKSVLAIQTEVSFFPLYEKQPSFGDVDVFLRKAGFVPHSFLHIEKRIILSRWGSGMPKTDASQMLDGDILYLRDMSQPDHLSADDLGRLALVAEGIYGFTDLVLKCLDLLEQRGAITADQVATYLALIEEKPDA